MSPAANLPQQARDFVREYMRDLDGIKAARRLGESPDAAARLLRLPGVADAIAAKLAAKTQRAVSPSRLLAEVLRGRRPARQGIIRAAQMAAAKRGIAIQRTRSILKDRLGPDDPEKGVYGAYWNGRCFHVFGDGPISQHILRGQAWDSHLKTIIHDVCRRHPKGRVVEVGANIGATFISECAAHPDVQFVMIEPLPHFFHVLEKNVESFEATNVEIHNVAISERRGDIVLVYDRTSGGIAADAGFFGTPRAAVIESISLDQLIPKDEITLLKADVDGYELDVFRGAEALIRRSRPDVLFEFNPLAIDVRGVEPVELPRTLATFGVGRFDIYSSDGRFIEATDRPERIWEVFRGLKDPLAYMDIHARAAT